MGSERSSAIRQSTLTAEGIIDLLGLAPLSFEGGHYVETYRFGAMSRENATDPGNAVRPVKTAIYYLLTPDTVSTMHRLPGDEIFHFYLGDPVRQLHLYPDGTGQLLRIGADLLAGDRPQVIVPGGTWQGARLEPGPHGFALLGTTMSPGFNLDDFEAGDFDDLSARYPEWREELARLMPRHRAV